MVVKVFRAVSVLAFLLGCHFAITADVWRVLSEHDRHIHIRKPARAAYCTLSASSEDSGCTCGTFSNFVLGDTMPWQRTASGFRSGTGVPGTITWSIVPDGTLVPGGASVPPGASDLNDFLSTTFAGGVTGETLIEQAFNRFELEVRSLTAQMLFSPSIFFLMMAAIWSLIPANRTFSEVHSIVIEPSAT